MSVSATDFYYIFRKKSPGGGGGGGGADSVGQCLSQQLDTGCLKLAFVKFLGVQMFKRDHNILIFQP